MICHCHISTSGLAIVTICDESYKQKDAFKIIRNSLTLFHDSVPSTSWENVNCDTNIMVKGIENLLNSNETQNPTNKTAEIQEELSETKDLLIKGIESILRRGENIDVLIEQSQDLTNGTKELARGAETLEGKCPFSCNII
eukprot:TRINITY_DN11262_c0_g1_i1.p1 TRINITY_DN11262_c0_g1~~TRINITY_DN11262_c0_g1_i1.p1  ORF type:complete len:141 (-),score=15.34 TRINITY_DN11262_c0_g1_i1:118-540(-)